MKKIILLLGFIISFGAQAQIGGWNPELESDSKEALTKMIETTPKLQIYKEKAYAYVVFPVITKAAFGIGAAGGKGLVYKNHAIVGSSKLKQASIGFQAGGQQYSEVIFFENKKAFDHFKNGNLKFNAQASAVAITDGASIDGAYVNNVAIFTRAKGGLMFEASVGGQHFTFEPIEKK